jgi:putrescine transport system substrate-binding protein
MTPHLRLVALVSALVAACAFAAAERVVNVFNWTNYIDDTAIPAFETRTGIRVNYDLMDSNDVLEGKLLAGNSGYDVVVPSGHFFGAQIQAGLYRPLDRAKLTRFSNLDPALLARVAAFDPDNRYGVPYMWGTSGIAYNVAKIRERMPDAPVTSWRMLFDPAVVSRFADCGVTVIDQGDDVIESALIHLGRDANSQAREDLDAAIAAIRAIQPHVRYFHGTSYVDDLANGEVCLAMGWSGDVLQAQSSAREGVDIRYVIPDEGAIIWFDLMAIPVDAPHPDEAHAWIDHILDAAVIAKISNATRYPNANAKARPLLDPAIGVNPTIYPPADVMQRLVGVTPKTPRFVRMRNRAWTQAKAGR